jgi:hypothetical protein
MFLVLSATDLAGDTCYMVVDLREVLFSFCILFIDDGGWLIFLELSFSIYFINVKSIYIDFWP